MDCIVGGVDGAFVMVKKKKRVSGIRTIDIRNRHLLFKFGSFLGIETRWW